MKKRKTPNSLFILEESNGVVTASMKDSNDYSFKHIIHEMPHPRVRAPRKKKEEIEFNSKYWANDPLYKSQRKYLKKTIKSCTQEINIHVQEIRKSLKRIQSLVHYNINAEQLLNELKDT